ncbi:MAG: T9SS type A sorting domain-containing protein, partial [Chitinophagaceae bacterium]|nr:T9SS type A sorting domain-containing protein [Chitinophagaceae bacterium]
STTYTAQFTVTNGGTDVAAAANIPVSLIIADPATNPSATYTTAISQASDPIDANTPTQLQVTTVTANAGGNVVSGYFNVTNTTGISLTVPLTTADASLTNGNIQLQIRNATLGFISLDVPQTITNADRLAGFKTISVSNSTLTSNARFGNGNVLSFNAIVSDLASNQTTWNTSTTSLIVDLTPPVVASIEGTSAVKSFGNRGIIPPGGSVDFLVTLTETNTPLSGIDPADFPGGAISTDGTVAFGARTVTATANPNEWKVTITGITGTGRISLGLTDDNTILDVAGNPLAGASNGSVVPSFSSLQYYTVVLAEPTNPVAALTAPTITTTGITVQWSQPAVGSQAATDYLVMAKPTTSGSYPSTVVDGVPVGDTPFIQNVVKGGGAQTASFSPPLNSGVSYDFIIYPYTKKTSDYTDNNIDFNTTTPATVTGIVTNVASVGTLALTSTPVQVGSLKNSSADAVTVLTYNLTDDGSTPAADNAPFKFTQLVVNNGNAVNWTQVLAGAILSDGNPANDLTIDFGVTPSALTSSSITFSSINSTTVGNFGYVPDNGTKGYTLKVWLKNPLGVIDNSILSFVVNNGSFSYDNSSNNQVTSKLNTVPAQSVNSGSNTVDVIATALRFTTQPIPTTHLVLTNFTTRPVVKAVDANGNVDIDFTGAANNVDITNAGLVKMNPGDVTPVVATPVAGIIDFNSPALTNFQYTDQNAGSFNGTLTLTKSGGGINSNSGAGSVACTPITVNYSNATTITAGSGIANISSIAATSIDVFSFTVTDDGGTGNDGSATKISAFKFTPNGANQFSDFRDLIATASLRDNSGNSQAATSINLADITFSSIPFSSGLGNVADNAAKIYTLSITLKPALGGTLPADADNKKLVFDMLNTVANPNITFNATGSTLPQPQTVDSEPSKGVFRVFATKLAFTTQPPLAPASYLVNVPLSSQAVQPVVQAQDARNNRDLDYVFAVNTTTSVVARSGQPTTFNSGIITGGSGASGFGDMQLTTIGTGAQITVTSSTLNSDIFTAPVIPTAAVSSLFDVKVGQASTIGSPLAIGPVPSTAYSEISGTPAASTGAASVFSFVITDDGSITPNDGNPTLIRQILFKQNTTQNSPTLADWRQSIAGAVLSDGTNSQTIDFSLTPNVTRTGTITASTASTTVTGTGTSFTTEISVGMVITNSGGTTIGTVAAISSNTSLTLVANASVGVSNGPYRASTLNATSILFSGINFAVGQLGYITDSPNPSVATNSKTYTLKIWLKPTLSSTLPIEIDGKSFGFDVEAITDIITDVNGSALSSGSAITPSGNTVNVVASKINYLTLPFTSVPSLPFPSSRGIYDPFGGTIGAEAVDINGNRDLNYAGVISGFGVANSLVFTNNPNGQAFTAGTFTFDTNFQYQTTGSTQNADGSITMTGAGPITGTSTAINIFSSTDSYVYFDPTFGAQVYSNIVNQQASSLPNPANATVEKLAQLILTDGEVSRTGTINASTASTTVTGIGTSFTTELSVGTLIKNSAGAVIGTVASIASNTSLTLSASAAVAVSSGSYRANVDADNAFTRISSITFTLTGAGTSDLRTLALYDNSGNKVSTDQPASSSITFNGLSIQAADGSINTFSIRGTFKEEIGLDRDAVTFKVASVTWSAGSRFFNFTNPLFIGGINEGSTSPSNQVNVVATSLDFVTQPSIFAGVDEDINASTGYSTGIVHARDEFANLDTDFNFPYVLSAAAGAVRNPATATFTNGVLDLVGMKYNTWGIGTLTVTSNSLTSANNLPVNSKPCVPINVISVSAIKVISGQPASASLRGGNVNTTIFGVFLKPNHFVSDQPMLKSLTFEFSTPYRTATRTTFKNFKVFEKRADSARVSAVNVSAFATLTEIESVSGSGNFDRVKVAFTSDRPLYPDGSSPATVTYFLETDIDVTASNNTPKITPRLVDLGQGDNSIEITQGSAKVSVPGREYSFASTRPPLLVGASCVPPTGTLNVSAGITSIGLTFDVPVVTFDKVAKLYYYNTDTLVATLEATNGIFDSDIEIINTPPVKTMNFKIPTGVVLRPDSVYYVTLAQGKYDPITKTGEGLSDDQLNLYGGIAYKGIYYFKIASNKPPAMVSTDATKYEATPTFASLNASFDQKGKGYYLILPNSASPAPTATQVKSGTYGGKLSSGTFAIDQLAPNLQYFTATGSFTGTEPYQVWIVAENDAPDLPRPSSGVFGSSPNFTAGATGPTFTFSQFTPTGANATPNFQLCPGSFSVVSQPIVLRESNSTGTNATWGIGTQNFNILLPTGFTFDSDYAPTIEQVGADFTIARTGTITASTSATTVTGSGTLFTTQLAPGHILKNSSGTTIGVVAAIASNTSLTLAANASVALTNGAYRSEQLPTFSFINSTLLRVTFQNAGSSSDDRLIISNMRISPSSVNSAGEIIRFGGSGLTNYGDLTRLAAIRANALGPQAFTNSYTQFNAFGSSVGINSVVTSIPDNFLDQNLNNRNVIRLIPKITPSNDYNASFFSGAGVTDDVLNLSGVTKNVAFDITMTRTDLNGCFLSQKEQYLVYDNTKIIPKLTVDVFGPKQAAANPNYKTPQDVDALDKRAPKNKSAQTLAAKDIAGYTMEEMVLKIPKETRESQIIQGTAWQAQLDSVLVQEGPTRNNANGTIERDYKWDFSPILNAKRVPGGVDKDPYVHFLATSPQGQTYYEGGSLGSVDFIGKFRNNADLLVFQPLVQRIELFVPAVPVVEVTGQSYKKPATGTKPPVYVYCEQGRSILFNGFPAASPGKSKAYYSIYDSALNTLLYDGKNPGGNVNKGFTDNANSNGTATLVPNFGPYFVNGYKTLRVTYTYQDDNSPAIGVGEIFIQIAPNPLAKFKFKSTPGVNAPNAFNDKSICSGNLIEFDAGESTVGGNSVVPTKYTYTWNFDNSKAINPPPATGVAASKPTHTFTDVRNYNVSLSMISDVGCPSIPMVFSGPQTTTPGPKVIPVKVGDIPVVDFSFKNNCVGDNIEFTDMSTTNVGSSTKARFEWEFGDGNNKEGFNPANQTNVAPNIFENFGQTPSGLVVTNTYTQPNIYTVKLTTTTNVGCSNSREKQIAILPLKTATAGAEFSEFFDASNGGWQALDLTGATPEPRGSIREAAIFNAGAAYTNGIYANRVLTGGTGNGAVADITVAGGVVTVVDIKVGGTGYKIDDRLSAAIPAGTGLSIEVKKTSISSWVWNAPTAPIAPGKWITESYIQNERSALYSACLDLSNVPRPVISFRTDIGLGSSEGLVLQYSKDSLNIFDPAKGWEVLGTTIDETSPGLDWYNAKALASNPGRGYTNSKNNSGYGWAGALGKIAPKHKVEDITGTTGLPNSRVIVRFALAALNADGSGIKIDSIRVGSRTRTILFENFTTTDGGTNTALNTNLKADADFIRNFTNANIKSTQLVNINYHIGFIGKDPFNLDNPADPSSRALFYNVSKVPYAFLDGKHGGKNGSDLFKDWGQAAYDLQTLQLANADFTPVGTLVTNVVNNATDKTMEIEVYVKPTRDLPKTTRLHIGVLEDSVTSAQLLSKRPSATITTGGTEFNYVLKKLIPDALGTMYPENTFKRDVLVRLAPGGKVGGTEKFKFTADQLYSNKLTVVVFLQDTTREVYQADLFRNLTPPAPITGFEPILADLVYVYPNPSDQEFTIELPVKLKSDAAVRLIDQVGRTHDAGNFAAGKNAKTVSTQGLASGVYIVEIRAEDGALIRKKVMVVH